MKYIEKHPSLMIVIGVLGISLSAIIVRYSDAPSAVTAAYRLLWTVLLMTPAVFLRSAPRRELMQVGKKTLLLCALSGLCLAAHFAIWFESLLHTSVASSTTIVCTEVIWVSLGYCLFLHGRISGRAALAIAAALGGSVLIALSDSSAGGGHLFGDFLALLAAVAVAVYTLLGQQVRKTVSTTVYTYLVYCAAAVALVAAVLAQGYSLVPVSPRGPLAGLLLAVFSTLLGHSIFSWCLKYFSPSFVSASKLCEPVVAALFAALLFGEIPAALQLTGGAVILASVFYYSRLEQREQAAEEKA